MIRDVTLGELMPAAARTWPNHTALTFRDQSWTYQELEQRVEITARKLKSLGLQPGDHAALYAANIPEWVFLEFALARIGAVLVTANTAFGRDDLAYLLQHSDAKFLFCGVEARAQSLLPIVADVSQTLPNLQIVVIESGEEDRLPRRALSFAEISPDEAPLPRVPTDLDLLVNMQYTSGTTGFPKGVMLSSRNIVNNAWRCGELLGLSPEDRVLCQVPLFHCFGCVVAILASATHGASVHLLRDFDPDQALDLIQHQRISVVHGVPSMFQVLLDKNRLSPRKITDLRTGIMAGAFCPEDLMQDLIESWGVTEMTIGYGLTEASPHVTYTERSSPPEQRCATIGVPVEGTEVKLVDPQTLKEGNEGEIWVRGEQVMLGYYRDPEATANTILEGGWLRTGDLATRDSQGQLRIVGRSKEMICRGGENIFPAEVERALRDHEEISDVAVFGIDHSRLGEQVAAAIISTEKSSLDERGVQAFLEGRISKTKIPAHVLFVDSLPLTASGKVKRFALKERLEQVLRSPESP